jgi:hypothetical protein
MSLARGTKGNARKCLIRQHRIEKLGQALELYIDGKVSAEYVKMRGDKVKAIRR